MPDERWPTIYDFDELARTIQDLVHSDNLRARFYEAARSGRGFFQGDVVAFRSELPLLNEAGVPATEEPVDYWMILGNTCDLERDVSEVPWGQIIPIWGVAPVGQIAPPEVGKLTGYRGYRQFYVPAWSATVDQYHHVADFTRPVTIHKQGLAKATVVARLTFEAWVLFHCCLVRFLARDDRRSE